MAETNIDEDGNITEQHMPLQEGAIHFTTRRGIFGILLQTISILFPSRIHQSFCLYLRFSKGKRG